MPDKSGIDAELWMPPVLADATPGATSCPRTGVAAAVDNVTNKRKARRREFMLRSLWFRRHWASEREHTICEGNCSRLAAPHQCLCSAVRSKYSQPAGPQRTDSQGHHFRTPAPHKWLLTIGPAHLVGKRFDRIAALTRAEYEIRLSALGGTRSQGRRAEVSSSITRLLAHIVASLAKKVPWLREDGHGGSLL
jgi:hypothetical protein